MIQLVYSPFEGRVYFILYTRRNYLLSLKQTVNRVIVEGYLNNKEWEIKKDKDGKTFIAGEISVKAGKDNIVPIEVFSYEKKNDGEDNAVFKGLNTVFEDTTASSETDDPNEVTKVRITAGYFKIDEYVSKRTGDTTSAAKYQSNFINRVNDESFAPKAEFEVEMIVQKLRPEVKNDEETGNGYIDGFIVDYSGNLKPLTLKAPEKVFAKLEKQVDPDDNPIMIFYGDIINSVETKKITIEVDFGEDKERVITNSRRERIVTGGKFSEKEIDHDDLKEAKKQRKKYLETLKDKAKGTFDGGKNNEPEDDDELPF